MPRVALPETVNVNVDEPEPGAAIVAGLKLAVTPEGRPLADKPTDALKPPETAVETVTVPLRPLRIEPEVGETAIVNAPLPGAVTVSETVAVFVTPPPVPVIVIA